MFDAHLNLSRVVGDNTMTACEIDERLNRLANAAATLGQDRLATELGHIRTLVLDGAKAVQEAHFDAVQARVTESEHATRALIETAMAVVSSK